MKCKIDTAYVYKRIEYIHRKIEYLSFYPNMPKKKSLYFYYYSSSTICFVVSRMERQGYLTLLWNMTQASTDLPGGPVVRAACSHCWGPGFNPWSEN